MDTKINDAWAGFDALDKTIETADLTPVRTKLGSTIFATVLSTAILFGVYYSMSSPGFNPVNLHKGLHTLLGLIAAHCAYDLWKPWRSSRKASKQPISS